MNFAQMLMYPVAFKKTEEEPGNTRYLKAMQLLGPTTASQLAAHLGVSRQSVHEWIRRHEGRYVRAYHGQRAKLWEPITKGALNVS